jgi:hypothetical protein
MVLKQLGSETMTKRGIAEYKGKGVLMLQGAVGPFFKMLEHALEDVDDTPEYLDRLDGMGWFFRVEAYSKYASLERESQLKRMEEFVPSAGTVHFEAVEHLLERLG